MISQKIRKGVTPVVEDEHHQYSDDELYINEGYLVSRSPLFMQVLPLVAKEAYVMLRDTHTILRQWHRDCPGTTDTMFASRPAKMRFIAENPRCAVIDVSRYPQVAEDGEWEYYVKHAVPSMRECTCSLRVFMKESRVFQRRLLTLPHNYFYLTGLNVVSSDLNFPCQLAKVKK